MTPSLPSLHLIDRYLAGESTPDETARIQKLLDDPEGRTLVDALSRMEAGSSQPSPNTQRRWVRLERAILSEAARPKFLARASRWSPVRWWSVTAAAMTIVASVAAILSFSTLKGTANDKSPMIVRQFASPRGQQRTVLLTDGSSITLAPETRLRVALQGTRMREVTLNGAAHFVVQSSPTNPFVVQAGDGIVRVLGTEFTVRHYQSDPSVHVAVVSGRVALRATDNAEDVNVVLSASDVAELGPGSRVTVMRDEPIGKYLGWLQGRLVIQNKKVSYVLAELGRLYDLDFRVTDSVLAKQTVTATFHKVSVDELLEVLSMLLHANVRRDGRTILLSARNAQSVGRLSTYPTRGEM